MGVALLWPCETPLLLEGAMGSQQIWQTGHWTFASVSPNTLQTTAQCFRRGGVSGTKALPDFTVLLLGTGWDFWDLQPAALLGFLPAAPLGQRLWGTISSACRWL